MSYTFHKVLVVKSGCCHSVTSMIIFFDMDLLREVYMRTNVNYVNNDVEAKGYITFMTSDVV